MLPSSHMAGWSDFRFYRHTHRFAHNRNHVHRDPEVSRSRSCRPPASWIKHQFRHTHVTGRLMQNAIEAS